MAGFAPAAGTDFSVGDEPELAKRLDALAKYLDIDITGISGYRTPAHSVAVGGTANDPHTKAKAADTSANVNTIPEATLNEFGLTRPMTTWNGNDERNHIQLASASHDTRKRNTVSKIALGASVAGVVGAAAGATADVITGSDDPVIPDNPVTNTVDKATMKLAGGLVDAIWGAIKPEAEYGGLFLLLIVAGAALVVFGVVRTTGHKETTT